MGPEFYSKVFEEIEDEFFLNLKKDLTENFKYVMFNILYYYSVSFKEEFQAECLESYPCLKTLKKFIENHYYVDLKIFPFNTSFPSSTSFQQKFWISLLINSLNNFSSKKIFLFHFIYSLKKKRYWTLC